MNKALLMLAAAGMVGAVTASALAQPAPPPPQQAQPGGPPPPGPGPQARGPMPPGYPPGEGQPGMYGPPRGWRHGPPSRAAAFHIERGNISIGVRCAESEPMRACVDAAIALMDKANTLTTP
jgi:hypothetical protein